MTDDSDDELLPPTPEQAEYLRKQQDPYAKLSVTLRGDNAVDRPGSKTTASKEEFDAESRRILGLYIPAVENQLRPHHRAFIVRNLARTPMARYKVLNQLRKYDLSDVPGFEARFNREEDELTEAKLKEIELAAGVDD